MVKQFRSNSKIHSMRTELLLINFHDNDFYFPMCKTAKFLLEESNSEKSFPSTHIENYKNVIPRMMAIFQYMNHYHAGYDITDLQHYEKYFSEHTDYIVGIKAIREHIEKYNISEVSTECSGLYNDELFNEDPYCWLYSLKLNLNSEAILLLFTDFEYKIANKCNNNFIII